MFGLLKINILLAFTLAAYNLEVIRSFLAKSAEAAKKPRTRKKRLNRTWRDLVATPKSQDRTHRRRADDPS